METSRLGRRVGWDRGGEWMAREGDKGGGGVERQAVPEIMTALGHQMRWRMLGVLAKGEITAKGLKRELGGRMAAGTYWWHLNRLRAAGLVRGRRPKAPREKRGGVDLYVRLDREVLRGILAKVAVELGL